MKRAGGRSVQDYNVQVVANEAQLIVAAEVTPAQNDSAQLEPMVATAKRELEQAGVEEPIGTVLAEAAIGTRLKSAQSAPEGKALYRGRQQLVEPVFADVKFNRRADRFLRRGLGACNSEWRLIAATHNLLKLWRASLAPQPGGNAGRDARLLLAMQKVVVSSR